MPLWAIRFLPWVAAGIAALWLGLVVNGWRKDSAKLPEVERNFAVYVTATETSARVRREVSDEYQDELTTLRAGQRQPAPSVRLCQSPAAVVPTGGAAGRGDGASAGAGQLPAGTGTGAAEGPGPDIGADLFRIADRADELAAQLRACQSFVGKVRSDRE